MLALCLNKVMSTIPLCFAAYTALAQIEPRRSNFRPGDFGAIALKFEPKNESCNQEFGTKSELFDKAPL